MPDASIGDLGAQIAAIRTGERRLSQLLERIGIDTYRAACENIFEQARRMDREAIAAIKDGTWYREGYLDSDGAGEDPVKVALTLTVKGEELIVDLAGSSGLVPGIGQLRREPDRVAAAPRLQDDDQSGARDHRRLLRDK